MNMKKIFFIALFIILLASCTANKIDVSECITNKPDGFWMGLWHGMIAPITFIISLFSDTITMYSKNNNGGWYDFGFVIGAGILLGGSSKSRRK